MCIIVAEKNRGKDFSIRPRTQNAEVLPLYSETVKISMMWQILHGFLLRFSPECSIFTPQMALALGAKWFHKILNLILCIGFHELGLFARFVA
jgi:hypothetical protein